MRGIAALIQISRSRRRGFAAAAALNSILISALFGSLIPLPLHYQLVRHETPLQTGLLRWPAFHTLARQETPRPSSRPRPRPKQQAIEAPALAGEERRGRLERDGPRAAQSGGGS
jgi:hypothetical protein